MCDDMPDLSDYSGFVYRASHICAVCFAAAFREGELVACESCDHWTTPDDPYAGIGTSGSPCVTDNHATPFGKDMATEYPSSCDRCHRRIETRNIAEHFQGTLELDAWLTAIYRLVIDRRVGNADSLRRFGELVDMCADDYSKDDDYLHDLVSRWLKGESLPTEQKMADLLDGVAHAILAQGEATA